jgi:hypothetical protein
MMQNNDYLECPALLYGAIQEPENRQILESSEIGYTTIRLSMLGKAWLPLKIGI